MKNIYYFLIFLFSSTSILISCKKESTSKLELEQVGTNNFKPSIYGIRGFNHQGSPIVHHDLNYFYELDESNNSFHKIGNTLQNPLQIAGSKVVQDALGNYFYHTGSQGEILILNTNTNTWDTANIAPGYKNQMIANSNGDILVYINNINFGGNESFYKKASNSSNWVKILDIPINNPLQMAPQFMNNNGLAFFTNSTGPANEIDGSNGYNEIVLNTNTAMFETFYDKTDPDNFPAIEANAYAGFNCCHVTNEGVFYILQTTQVGVKTCLYKISSQTLPAKFVKIAEFNHPPLESGSYITVRGCKINESTGEVKFRSSCQFGMYSHKNLGTAKINSSEMTVLQHDGPQNTLISSPNGTVYVQNYEGYLYKWK